MISISPHFECFVDVKKQPNMCRCLINMFLILAGISSQFPGKQAAPTTRLHLSKPGVLNEDFVKVRNSKY